mmetsp:Transcript_10936/g.31744  ORF Transcript_10936/g.31744 Transcript_10936/m.31744 type:complete len:1115 (+) Transcript_10936:384-3728(+)|eukprot:CAMPEP_0172369412 /NCGR_PEP_ID=MMETSP1060-20121228/32710_1 /TAXON_ID=37318 /ORGANISM="Pseudo-nitzschia pungens, Strain cf. cingulata" /LENGTH=1114 /DNA_ID=CAMNT_0013094335 /DNA_START=103 /DNA_END=3447 /DNA_ORIENTATION=+
MNNSNSSLRPGWFKGPGAGGGKGFQPPPTASDRGEKGRSGSNGRGDDETGSKRDSNIFAALLDDDGVGSGVGDGNGVVHASESSSKPPPVISSSRSEAFRSSFNRSSSSGGSRRSLADLAARVPELSSSSGHGGRRHSGHLGGVGGSGRFSHMHSHDGSGGPSGSIESFKPDPKVIRYTREKLLSLRFAPRGEDQGPPEELKPLEVSVIISATAQDPVCWDTFDAEEIWEMAREQRRSSSAIAGKSTGGLEDQRRRTAPSSGRWSRGLALPPQDENSKRKGDVDNPNELWDDPVGGVIGAASDFSAFGAMPVEDGAADPFDFDKMAEASAKLELELHGERGGDDEVEQNNAKKIDISRPLASAGTTLISGSGNDVNVFEDFDTPVTSDSEGDTNSAGADVDKETVAVRGGDEDPNASSRLMKMIGVSRDPSIDATQQTNLSEPSSNPWGSSTNLDVAAKSTSVDPIIGGIGGTSISLNPWGDSIISGSTSSQQTGAGGGMTLGGIHLSAFAEEKNREAQIAAEREKMARREAELLARRRQEEEEKQRRLLAQQQQQQQTSPQQSQIELILMERICTILENSWGRSDLLSVLRTLHSEDSRLINLLGNIDALRALIARSPQRVSLRRDPGLAGEIAVLVMTNAQWQEQRQIQARIQQEQLRRRHMEEEAKARLQAQNQLTASIKRDAPWYYSDPQNNIQGPFRGEEMRQWLEAGYFKGDLPISQLPNGPFHQLSNWFPDLNSAFTAKAFEGQNEKDAAAAALELQRKNEQAAAEAERQRLAEEMEAKNKAEEEAAAVAAAAAKKEVEEAAARSRERERQNAAEMQASANGGNQSSTQLKMMLGLSAGEQPVTVTEKKAPDATNGVTAAKKTEKKTSKVASKNTSPKPAEVSQGVSQPEQKPTPVVSDPVPAPAPVAPAAPAWGGVANNKPRKSMSEIQQEEARAAAILAAKRGNMPQASSSGWANVAAGSSGWSSGAIRTSAGQNPAPVTSVRPGQAPSKPQTKKVAVNIQKSTPASSARPAEEFGATMSPVMEKWCKEKMQQINGSDDLTLVAFCMTLNDASEIRQYLTTYLGSTSQVNNFATEFINKRGLGSKQEEWETPGSTKKGRKKKSGR